MAGFGVFNGNSPVDPNAAGLTPDQIKSQLTTKLATNPFAAGSSTPPAAPAKATAPAASTTPAAAAPAFTPTTFGFGKTSNEDPWGTMTAEQGFSSPGSSLINPGSLPQIKAQSMAISPELQHLLSGAGFSDSTLAQMHAGATQAPATAGLQEMGQVKRALGQAGITGPAAAAYQGNVARQTGQNQVAANRDVDTANAQAGLDNQRFAIDQQTGIGKMNVGNAQAVAVQNALDLINTLKANQDARMGTQQQLGAIQ